MSTAKGIITVVDQSDEQEDEDLIALRGLPRFEPLIANGGQPSHFSLASVFGTLSTQSDSNQASPDAAFNANVLVDIFVQMNAHSQKCAADIQDYQRSLGLKIKALDAYTAGAVQELVSIHQRAKAHSDQLLSVHALTKQAHTTTGLLQGIMDKIAAINDSLPADVAIERPSEEQYPNLCRYLQRASHPELEHSLSTGSDSRTVQGAASTPSGLALLGQNPSRRTTAHPPSTAALAVPKARASMALASSSMDFLSAHTPTTSEFGNEGSSGPGGFLTVAASRSFEEAPSFDQGLLQWDTRGQTGTTPQQRASDNLRKLASRAPPSQQQPYYLHDQHF